MDHTHTTEALRDRDRSLAGLLQRNHGLKLEERPNPSKTGLRLTAIAIRPNPDQNGALLAIREALKPAKTGDITDALLRLNAKVETPYGDDAETRLSQYADSLLAFPGDVVMVALAEWPDTQTKWPPWAALKLVLDDLSSFRRRMLVAVQGLDRVEVERDQYPAPDEADVAAVHAIRDRTIAALRAGSGKPRAPDRTAIEGRLQDLRDIERAEAEAALHGDAEVTP